MRKSSKADSSSRLHQAVSKLEMGASVTSKVKAEPVGAYHEEVKLDAEEGQLSRFQGTPPFTATWNIGELDESGEYRFAVNGADKEGVYRTAYLTVIVLSPEEEIEVESLDLTHTGSKLLNIKPKDFISFRMTSSLVNRLNIASSTSLEIEFGSEATFTGRGLDSGVAGIFLQKFDDLLESLQQLSQKTTVRGIVKLSDTIILDANKINALSQLNGKAKFRLRVTRQ